MRRRTDASSLAVVGGERFRILKVVDDYTRANLCLAADTSLPGGGVIRDLEAVAARRSLSRQYVPDNGPEFTGLAMLRWAQSLRLDWHYIDPGKPQQNAFVESFNGRLREGLLTRRCTPHSHGPASSSRSRGAIITPNDRTACSAIWRRSPMRLATPAPQQAEAPRVTGSFAPRPIATPDLTSPNNEWILLSAG